MQRPSPLEYNPYFQKYINLVPEGNFLDVFKQNAKDTIQYFENLPQQKHDYQYAPGKWTIKEVLMHIIDTERVMAYRALVAARGDSSTPLHSMDEDLYAQNVDVSNRTMSDLLSEFKAVRSSTEKIYENLTEEKSLFLANGVTHPITARALGYIMAGHIQHHINVIAERYL